MIITLLLLGVIVGVAYYAANVDMKFNKAPDDRD